MTTFRRSYQAAKKIGCAAQLAFGRLCYGMVSASHTYRPIKLGPFTPGLCPWYLGHLFYLGTINVLDHIQHLCISDDL